MLHLRGMLEAAVHDGAQHLGLEEEVAEAGGVDGHVVALHLPLLQDEVRRVDLRWQ